MKYLGIEPSKPKVAVFDFTGCEGCELQLANKEETLVDFLERRRGRQLPRDLARQAATTTTIALIEGCDHPRATRSSGCERSASRPRCWWPWAAAPASAASTG